MSAYVLERDAFIKIGSFVKKHGDHKGLHVYSPGLVSNDTLYLKPADVANMLASQNCHSVNVRYREATNSVKMIFDRDLRADLAPAPAEMYGLLTSLQYQSSDSDNYRDSRAAECLIQVLWLAMEQVAKQAGAKEWA